MSTTSRRRQFVAAFLGINVALGTVFAGLAAGTAMASEEPLAESVTESPTPEPTVEPTTVPESRTVARATRVNADGSTTIDWDNGLRDETDPNFPIFQNLSFTISKSSNLTYEIVELEWEGGSETSESEFAYDYMQIMQCWDDGSGSADPARCQFGMGSNGASLVGQNASTRNLIEGEDVKQEYQGRFQLPADPGNPFLRQFQVPFEPASGDSTFNLRTYFDAASTNEIIGVRTEGDGTGSVPFEVQTSLEAPHLGCGGTLPNGSVRDCFLVVVPRGQYSVDGSAYYDGPTPRVSGSPLSASAWANRVEFPLDFQSVKSGCPIGASEERTVGNEIIAEAFNSWQSALCKAKTVFGFSQIGDAEARRQIVSDVDGAARLAVVANPLSVDESTGETMLYGPVAQSAIVIAFNIEYDLRGQSDLIEKNGRPVTDLVLNQRLVAKLMTQSYQSDVAGGSTRDYLAENPINIARDPEFLELNPEFAEFQTGAGPTGILQPLGNADAFQQLWRWVVADDDAEAFLDGTADEWGMVVNKFYRDLDIPADSALDSLPKADLSTYLPPPFVGDPHGTFELRPYVADMFDSAVRVRRADPGTKIVWDQQRNPPGFATSPPQSPGTRFILGVTDIASASRLKLPMARLTNASGTPIAPTSESISTAIASLDDTAIPGVVAPNPSMDVAGGYPLATVAYAAVSVCDATLKQLANYKKLLTFAKGKGQTLGSARGNLPEGYVPLSGDQKSSLAAMISQMSAEISSPVCPEHAEVSTIPTVPYDPDTVESLPITETVPVLEGVGGKFAGDPDSAMKYSLLSALFFGAPCIAGGRLLIRKANAIND